MKAKLLLAMILLSLSGLLSAADVSLQDSVGPIVAQQKTIRIDVKERHGGWKSITEEKRSEFLRKQERLLALLERTDVDSISDLNVNERVEVINTLEWISAIAKGAENDRLICRRIRPTGSRLSTQSCKTTAQMAQEREAVRDGLRAGSQMSRSQQPKPDGF